MNNEIATISDQVNDLNNGQVSVYSSIKGDDFESKKRVLAATTNAARVDENIGKTIMLKDVVVQAIDISDTDDKTGEVTNTEAARIILIDADGSSYAAVSTGLFRALTNLFGILGEPHTWPEALPIQVVKERAKSNAGHYFTVRLVEAPETAKAAK